MNLRTNADSLYTNGIGRTVLLGITIRCATIIIIAWMALNYADSWIQRWITGGSL